MAYRIHLERRARKDAEEAFLYIAKDSPAAAADWLSGFLAALRSLEGMPHRYPVAPEDATLRCGLRQLLYGKYRMLFTVNEGTKTVHVLHLRHGARRPAGEQDLPDRGAE